jgi:hypothetical protein
MRAVGFRRQWITLDVARRYRFASSLEHYNIFVDRGFLRFDIGLTFT